MKKAFIGFVAGCVFALGGFVWAYNIFPYVEKPRHDVCSEGWMMFDVLSHKWECGMDWNYVIEDAGVHGI